jgi:hypothetical protein
LIRNTRTGDWLHLLNVIRGKEGYIRSKHLSVALAVHLEEPRIKIAIRKSETEAPTAKSKMSLACYDDRNCAHN